MSLGVKFVDFWFDDFDFEWFDPFYTLLNELYDVEQVEDNPDILFFSSFGNEHFKYHEPTKIFYTAEVRSALKDQERFADADYSFTFHVRPNNDRHYRLPNWVGWRGYDNLEQLTKQRDPDTILEDKSKFCNFLYSNSNPEGRKTFFKELSKYKKVDSGGSVLNNIGREIEQGKCVDWTKDYKFNIVFENQKHKGYVTEKILRAYLAETIPIYWGSDYVTEDFNPNSMIYVENMDDVSYYVDKVKEIDQDDERYRQIIAEPPFSNNQIPGKWREDKLKEKMREVVEG